MKNTDKDKSDIFYIVFILITVFKFSFAGFLYTPYLDDYVQYLYYPYFNAPLKEILFGGPGTAYTRPFAAILDVYFWSGLFSMPYVVLVFLSVLFAVAGIFFFKVLKNLSFPISHLFLIIFTLLPSTSEGTYWVSAATRIIPGLFFTAISLYYMTLNKTGLFFMFSLLSHGFYEQICILSFFSAFLIFIYDMKQYYKEFICSCLSLLLISSFYFVFGKLGNNAGRLSFEPDFLLKIGKNFISLYELFYKKQIPLYTKGFVRSLNFIKATNSFLWLCILFFIGMFLFLFYPKEKKYFFSWKKLAAGLILFFVPTLPFLVLKNPWLNFRNIVPSLLGFAIITDLIFTVIFKDKIKYITVFLAVYLCVCNVSEVVDYQKTASSDFNIIQEIAGTYNGEDTIYYEIKTEKYAEQNSPYHDHIISVVGTDWGLTGCVRAVLNNRDIKVFKCN